jgi:RHS repeat-associated protein
VSIAPGTNRAAAATLTDPDGTTHDYTYAFDSNGALQAKTKTDVTDPQDPDPPTTTTTYTYDDFGNLRHVALPDGRSIDYLIDATQRRVGRVLKDASNQVVDERRWLYQSGLRPVAELDGNNQVQSFFVYADKPNIPEYMVRDNEKYRIITDHLGSLRLVAHTSTGEIKQRMLHDEHGNVIEDYVASGWDPLPFGFAGGLYDRDTGLVRFGARDFDPEIARWTAQDPIGFGGGEGNLYTYVANDPINTSDPLGLRPGDEFQTIDQAAIDAIDYYLRRAGRENREYGGWVYYLPERNRYSYVAAVRGTSRNLNVAEFTSVPSGARETAIYHIHPGDDIGSQFFSTDDYIASGLRRKDIYLGTESGLIKVWMASRTMTQAGPSSRTARSSFADGGTVFPPMVPSGPTPHRQWWRPW